MLGLDSVKKTYYKIFGTYSDRELRKLQPLVSKVNSFGPKMKGLSNDDLKAYTPKFREMIDQGASLDSMLPEAFAVIREVGVRVLNMRHYDVQIQGGIVLHRGIVAEMKTGEGKTLCATLPVYLNALSGKGVHVVTVNDYLADRDADWMGAIYNFMGLSVGKVLSNDRYSENKKNAYRADITYGTNNEFGFDYLRDNMKFSIDDYVQRGHNYAIIDEVDSILIDEARTPLIISGPARSDVEKYYTINDTIPTLQADLDYIVDEKGRSVTLTDRGIDQIEKRLGIDNLYEPHNMESLHHVNQALKAHTLFKRDRDYVVKDGDVMIVDEHTGRLMKGRRWSDGLHQAMEAKEKVEVQPESQTYASITYQNYFRMYEKLSGMTGTAETEAEEFRKIYNLDVLVVDTNKPIIRKDQDDIIYKTYGEKFKAVMAQIEQCNAKGQPVLVGTVSVEKSNLVSRLLRQRGIKHEVLNAKNHSREADIVAQAGRIGSVTVSTNMAGRGTDIKLGGDPEAMAKAQCDPEVDLEGYQAALAQFEPICLEEKKKVLAAGGLFILGTERHESRRIDNQLRGRSGRQGDPGESRFYLCLEDDLLRIFGSDRLLGWMERMGMKDDEAIEHRFVTAQIEKAQKRVEGYNFNIRKNLLEYDDVMNLQRTSIYDMRRKALNGENINAMIYEAIESLTNDIVEESMDASSHPESWDIKQLRDQLSKIFSIDWEDTDEVIRDKAFEEIRQRILQEANEKYQSKEEELGGELMRKLERMYILQYTDQFWQDHLLAMDRLRDGIGLRGYGQRNPLLEYKREGTDMFLLMNSLRDEAVLSKILTQSRESATEDNSEEGIAIQPFSAPSQEEIAALAARRQAMLEAQKQEQLKKELEAARPEKGLAAKEYGLARNIGRNDPCPCGSNKKFKKCCMKAV